MPLAWPLLPRTAFAIVGLFRFHVSFRTVSSTSVQKAVGILIGVALTLCISSGSLAIFT